MIPLDKVAENMLHMRIPQAHSARQVAWASMIAEKIEDAQPGSRQAPLLTLSDKGLNEETGLDAEYYVLLKPEILDLRAGVKVRSALTEVFTCLEKHGCLATRAVLLTADGAEGIEVIRRQYFVLDRVAEAGLHVLPSDVHASSVEICVERHPQARIISARQSMRELAINDAAHLRHEWDRQGGFKIGPGIYGCQLDTNNPALMVLNGFYPAQFASLTRDDGYLLLLAVRGHYRLAEFRAEVVGDINPATARPGSIRRELYRQRAALGIADISVANNAIHAAPNSFDAMSGIGLAARLSGDSLDIETSRFWSLVVATEPALTNLLHTYADFRTMVTPLQLHLHMHTENLEPHECIDVLRKLQCVPELLPVPILKDPELEGRS